MSILEGWLPPSRENWEFLVTVMQYFPVVTAVQWITDWYPQGKTSIDSALNFPGKFGWFSMEVPGMCTLLYIMFTLPPKLGIESLPPANWIMAGLFVVHYFNRAVITPLFLNPTMSPVHLFVWCSAFSFQVLNSIGIAGWLAGYGPTTSAEWADHTIWVQVGVVVFVAGLVGNVIHDEELRAIRRNAAKKQAGQKTKKKDDGSTVSVAKVYEIPTAGLFQYILYPHYVTEWIEWIGFWIIGGSKFIPGQNFVINEITTMAPRALGGRRWYIKKFGYDKIKDKAAIIPGVL